MSGKLRCLLRLTLQGLAVFLAMLSQRVQQLLRLICVLSAQQLQLVGNLLPSVVPVHALPQQLLHLCVNSGALLQSLHQLGHVAQAA